MNKHDLIQKQLAGERLDYLFFWGHQPLKDGSIGKSCLSQWWPAAFRVEGIEYLTAEHWMMAAKARLFDDQEILEQILAAKSPKKAKELGRKIANYDDERWQVERYQLVVAGNQHKFSQNPELGIWLQQTGKQILVEASPVDAIWGIGLDENHPDAVQPARWPGLNLLGFALMEVRGR